MPATNTLGYVSLAAILNCTPTNFPFEMRAYKLSFDFSISLLLDFDCWHYYT